jgi:hypothetical protein
MSADRDPWILKQFPTPAARKAADAAIDALNEDETMKTYLDAWIAAYIQAGGKTKLRFT